MWDEHSSALFQAFLKIAPITIIVLLVNVIITIFFKFNYKSILNKLNFYFLIQNKISRLFALMATKNIICLKYYLPLLMFSYDNLYTV